MPNPHLLSRFVFVASFREERGRKSVQTWCSKHVRIGFFAVALHVPESCIAPSPKDPPAFCSLPTTGTLASSPYLATGTPSSVAHTFASLTRLCPSFSSEATPA